MVFYKLINKMRLVVSMMISCLLLSHSICLATNYTVSTKVDLIAKMGAASPGDTVIVSNGSYNWGQVSFSNKNGSATSAWIVLKSETFNGVIFTGNTYIQFSGKHILVTGFRFANGNSGANDVVQFRSSSSVFANYCRVSNITIDNYNSDSTGSTNNTGTKNGGDTLNRWVSLYGTHNRVDHCTFINKFNGSPTVVIWYDSTNYPARGTSTFHLIDSNYFKGRGYQGSNEGEVIRIGTSVNSRTDGYNIIEYNLFEDGTQIDPEIISNKSGFNTYRYNTFRDHAGGITLREGRYCNVYGNYFIKTNTARSSQYGIRIIDKGHRVYNNYLENLDGNYGSNTSLRCPIILFNGVTNSNDTANPAFAAKYFAADSAIVAFNTIVNCYGGAGIVLGFEVDSLGLYKPQGVTVANNLVSMKKGQAVYIDSVGTGTVTYTAEGNLYSAPSGLGIGNTTGFTKKTLTFKTRANGILPSPSLVQDAGVNTSNYVSLLNGLDIEARTRSAIYDVGALELNGTGNVIAIPLDSTMVGAGTPVVPLPVKLISFDGTLNARNVTLKWSVTNEINLLQYEVEVSANGNEFTQIGSLVAAKKGTYSFLGVQKDAKSYYRLKMVNKDGSFSYSKTISVIADDKKSIFIYPNPASSYINIVSENTNFNKRIIILDALGRKVLEKILPINGSTIISTSTFINGTYFLQMIEGDKVSRPVPFIISR